jgi:hypothetical protein
MFKASCFAAGCELSDVIREGRLLPRVVPSTRGTARLLNPSNKRPYDGTPGATPLMYRHRVLRSPADTETGRANASASRFPVVSEECRQRNVFRHAPLARFDAPFDETGARWVVQAVNQKMVVRCSMQKRTGPDELMGQKPIAQSFSRFGVYRREFAHASRRGGLSTGIRRHGGDQRICLLCSSVCRASKEGRNSRND